MILMKVEVLLLYILGDLCMSCILIYLRHKGVYHRFRPLLVFVHVDSLLNQYWVEVGFFLFYTQKLHFFCFNLRIFIKRDCHNGMRVVIYLGPNKGILFCCLQDN